MRINTISDFRRAVRLGPYAWPGGYPTYWVMSDGSALAFDVCKSERHNMLRAIYNQDDDGWRPVALDINWDNPDLICEHTNRHIASAYGDDK